MSVTAGRRIDKFALKEFTIDLMVNGGGPKARIPEGGLARRTVSPQL